MRRICRPVLSVCALNWSVLTADVDELTYQNTFDSGFSFTSHNCGSTDMEDAGGLGITQSQIWNRMVAFNRKLFGSSSVLPGVVLEMVTEKSQTVLLQQTNSVEMPDEGSSVAKCLKLQETHSITMPNDSAIVVIEEDSRPNLNATEGRHLSPESMESPVLPIGEELITLFDSDVQKESNSSAALSASASEFQSVLNAVHSVSGSAI